MDKVAIVILNWNGEEMLARFLPSVTNHSHGEGVGIYVVDNGSTDNSVKLLQTRFPEVKLIRLKENYGFAEGYNQALAQVESQYVVLLNSDVETTPSWLTPLMAYMDEHPEVAACQPKIKSWHDREAFEYAGAAGGFIDKYGYPFCRGRLLNTVEKDHGQYNTIVPVFWATGAALCIRLADYRSVGGLDGRFFAHMEEIDLCWRLRSKGRGIVCVPDSVVYHVGGGTLKKENPKKTFLNFRNNLLLLYKNLPTEELEPILRIRRGLDYLAAFSFLLKGSPRNAMAVIKARKAFRAIRNDFEADRVENMKKSTVRHISERVKSSILVAYYIKGVRAFAMLGTKSGEQKKPRR